MQVKPDPYSAISKQRKTHPKAAHMVGHFA